jgi:hypothetical protein
MSNSLGDLSRWWKGVDDVEGFAEAEILVRHEVHGRGSRSRVSAFEKTKGSRAKRWCDTSSRGR